MLSTSGDGGGFKVKVVDGNKSLPRPRGVVDYTNFRTPSGKFYCPMCNVTLNTESHFAQHCQSKQHRQRNLDKKYQDLNQY